MLNSRLVRANLLPGLALQSVIVAGDYATGREVVEHITSCGALGGLLALVVATIPFSAWPHTGIAAVSVATWIESMVFVHSASLSSMLILRSWFDAAGKT